MLIAWGNILEEALKIIGLLVATIVIGTIFLVLFMYVKDSISTLFHGRRDVP
jgi:hypothetical protein